MTFQEIKESIDHWLQEPDLRHLIDTFVQFGQVQLERNLRLRAMEVYPANGTLSSGNNTIAVPSLYIELIYFSILDGTSRYPVYDRENPLQFSKTVGRHSGDTTNTGRPQLITRKGDNFEFNRYADKNYSYEIAYFGHIAALSAESDTNWWTTNAPDALIYSSLVYAGPVLHAMQARNRQTLDPRVAIWASEYNRLMMELRKTDAKERSSGVKRRVRYID